VPWSQTSIFNKNDRINFHILMYKICYFLYDCNFLYGDDCVVKFK
jgi:hypothetical protein